MKKLDVSDFLREVLAESGDLPDGLEERLIQLVNSAPTQRWVKVRDLFSEVSGE